MQGTSDLGRVRFTTREIFSETLQVFLAHWRTYLLWGGALVAIWIACGLASRLLHQEAGSIWTNMFVDLSFFLIVQVPQMLFCVRVYRLAVLGRYPEANIPEELFSHRSWRFIRAAIAVNLKVLFICMVVVMIPAFLVGIDQSVFEKMLGSPERINDLFLLLGSIGEIVAFCLLAEQVTLIYPDVAVDGTMSLWRLKKRAGYARWRIVLVMALIRGGPFAWSMLDQLLITVGREAVWKSGWCIVVVQTAYVMAASLAAVFAEAVLYKRLSPPWPALDALDGGEPKPGRVPIEREVAKAAAAAGQAPGASLACGTPGHDAGQCREPSQKEPGA